MKWPHVLLQIPELWVVNSLLGSHNRATCLTLVGYAKGDTHPVQLVGRSWRMESSQPLVSSPSFLRIEFHAMKSHVPPNTTGHRDHFPVKKDP